MGFGGICEEERLDGGYFGDMTFSTLGYEELMPKVSGQAGFEIDAARHHLERVLPRGCLNDTRQPAVSRLLSISIANLAMEDTRPFAKPLRLA